MATSKVLKPRRGSTAEHSTFKGQAFEITFDTDKKTIVAHDGLTMGGFPLAHEADVAETDNALRALIDQKVSEVEGVSSSELKALESALRGLINSNAQQQVARDADQDNVISVLDSALQALDGEVSSLAGIVSSLAADVVYPYEAGDVIAVKYFYGGGFLTGSEERLYVSIPFDRPIKAASFEFSAGTITVRHTSGYIVQNAELSSISLQDKRITPSGVSFYMLKSGGWGGTNNSTVSYQIQNMTLELS